MKILILKPSSLGDVVHALPVLRMIKKHIPHARVHWWIESTIKELLTDDPDLDGIIIFERARWHTAAGVSHLLKSLIQMRTEQFDLVIDLQCLLRSALIGWTARGGKFIGLDQRRELAHLFYDEAVSVPETSLHAVEQYLQVVDYLGIPRDWNFEWLPEKKSAQESIKRLIQDDAQPWIAICPGASWHTKRWPPTYFAQTAHLLASRIPDVKFVILGTKEDAEAASKIESVLGNRCLNLTGKTNIPELVEILRKCRLTITNDSGPMHISAAVNTPIIAIFGPTDPNKTGPYKVSSKVFQADLPCVPCDRNRCHIRPKLQCMAAVNPDDVAESAINILNRAH